MQLQAWLAYSHEIKAPIGRQPHTQLIIVSFILKSERSHSLFSAALSVFCLMHNRLVIRNEKYEVCVELFPWDIYNQILEVE